MTNAPDPGERAAWEAIVADLSQDPDLIRHFAPAPVEPPPVELQADESDEDPFLDALLDDGAESSFVHPDPPLELPTHPVARFAWAAALGGPVLLILANVFSWGSFLAGVGAVAGLVGFVTLIARQPDEREDDGNDGAVV